MTLTNNTSVVAGDVKDTRIVVLGGVEDLSAVTACEAHIWYDGNSEDLVAVLVDPTARTVRVHLGDTGTDWLPAIPAVGPWRLEVECRWLDGTILTFPTKSPPVVNVRDQADP